MPTQTRTLVDFLLERIAEDEATAKSAKGLAPTPWRATYGRQVETPRDGLVTPEDEHSLSTEASDEVALHIARHDPARVLTECEAKRRIVERWDADLRPMEPGDVWVNDEVAMIMGFLAAVYADHPDYRDEWRPAGTARS